jgi:hypothetical protein
MCTPDRSNASISNKAVPHAPAFSTPIVAPFKSIIDLIFELFALAIMTPPKTLEIFSFPGKNLLIVNIGEASYRACAQAQLGGWQK